MQAVLVQRMLTSLASSHRWGGEGRSNFDIKLRRDSPDETKEVRLRLSPLGDNTPSAGNWVGIMLTDQRILDIRI